MCDKSPASEATGAEERADLICVPLGTVTMCLGLAYTGQPWLSCLFAAMVCFASRLAIHVERHGLISFLPESTKFALEASPFELLARAICASFMAASNLYRLVLILAARTNAQKRNLTRGMSRGFRRGVFARPTGAFLPRAARRLLFGRGGDAALAAREAEAVRAIRAGGRLPTATSSQAAPATGQADGGRGGPDASTEEDCLALARNEVRGTLLGGPLWGKRGATDGFLAVARVASAAGLSGEAAAQVAGLERFLEAAGSPPVAEEQSFLQFVAESRTQVAAASALGGAVVCGSGGAAVGFTTGGLLGAAVGLVPAVFTFGLSIPVGAAIGGGLGLGMGATVGGAAGLAGGGAAGWCAYGAARR